MIKTTSVSLTVLKGLRMFELDKHIKLKKSRDKIKIKLVKKYRYRSFDNMNAFQRKGL